jgi:hypothetical protein
MTERKPTDFGGPGDCGKVVRIPLSPRYFGAVTVPQAGKDLGNPYTAQD